MNKKTLVDMCRRKGLDSHGRRDELMARLGLGKKMCQPSVLDMPQAADMIASILSTIRSNPRLGYLSVQENKHTVGIIADFRDINPHGTNILPHAPRVPSVGDALSLAVNDPRIERIVAEIDKKREHYHSLEITLAPYCQEVVTAEPVAA